MPWLATSLHGLSWNGKKWMETMDINVMSEQSYEALRVKERNSQSKHPMKESRYNTVVKFMKGTVVLYNCQTQICQKLYGRKHEDIIFGKGNFEGVWKTSKLILCISQDHSKTLLRNIDMHRLCLDHLILCDTKTNCAVGKGHNWSVGVGIKQKISTKGIWNVF